MIPLGLGLVGLRYHLASRPIVWEPYSAAALDEHLRHGRTVLLNFHADWNLYGIANVDTPAVRRAIRSHNIVPMTADFTHASPEVAAALHSLGQNSVPLVAIYRGSREKPIILRDVLTEKEVLLALAASAER